MSINIRLKILIKNMSSREIGYVTPLGTRTFTEDDTDAVDIYIHWDTICTDNRNIPIEITFYFRHSFCKELFVQYMLSPRK